MFEPTVLNALLFALQLGSACVMVGIIWLVQIVHYPLLRWGDRARFAELSRLNQNWTSWVVGGPMLVEAVTAASLLGIDAELQSSPTYWCATLLLVVIWYSTAFFLIPLHRRLLDGFDAAALDGLVRRNWVRTWAWSLRGLLLAWIGWDRWIA